MQPKISAGTGGMYIEKITNITVGAVGPKGRPFFTEVALTGERGGSFFFTIEPEDARALAKELTKAAGKR